MWVEYREPKDEAEALEMAIADNEQEVEWDKGKLSELVQIHQDKIQLEDYKIDIKYQGLSDLLPNEVEEDDYEEPEEIETDIKRGDVFLLGKHRLMCGDATVKEDVEKLMDGEKADLLLTDPPYGQLKIFTDKKNKKVGVDSQYAKAVEYGGDYQGGGDFKLEPVLKVVDEIDVSKRVIWGGNFFGCLPVANSWLCWDKTGGNRNVKTFFSDFELAWTNLGVTMRIYHYLWKGMMREGERIKRVHPSEKPVALSAWVLTEYCDDCSVVLDLFGGSGSTLIACEQLDRICYMMEIDPKYCEIICQRWEKYTDGARQKVG